MFLLEQTLRDKQRKQYRDSRSLGVNEESGESSSSTPVYYGYSGLLCLKLIKDTLG